MSSRFQFKLAQQQDDQALRDCLANNHMGEGIRVSFRREPSYFNACQVQADQAQVIKCIDTSNDRIIGFGSRFTLEAHVNGTTQHLGYLADLRCEPEFRKGTLLARGYRYLRELHEQQQLPCYFTMILSHNQLALKQLTGQRAGLPKYQHMGTILSPAIHLDFAQPAISMPGLHFSSAKPDQLPAVFEFINQQLASKQFSPHYQVDDLGTDRLRGLSTDDIFLAWRDNRIVATLAAWDQSSFRQTHVEAYSTTMRFLKPFYNAAAKLSALKPLPKPGSQVPHLYFSMATAEHNDPTVFGALLRHVYRQKRAGPWHYAIIGLHQDDPLAACLTDYRRIATSGELFAVQYPDTELQLDSPAQRIPYIELARI